MLKLVIKVMRLIHFSFVLLHQYSSLFAQVEPDMPIRHVLSYNGDEREYFIQHPRNIDPIKTYLLLIVVHGGGGNGKFHWLANGIKKAMKDPPIDAIMGTPSYPKKY